MLEMVAKKFCCVALDLDGTLLDRQHQLSQRNRTVLKRLEEKGEG